MKKISGVSLATFFRELKKEIANDNVSNGAIFPALILLLSLVPYLPIPHVDQAILDLMRQVLPGPAVEALTGVVRDVATQKRGGLVSFGALATLWAAANGSYAIMQQLNITYDVKEGRSFLKVRGTALGLTILVGILIVAAFSLIVLGGSIQNWLGSVLGQNGLVGDFFSALRWVIVSAALLLAFAIMYYFGPDVEQRFRFISPGSLAGVALLIGASILFRVYVANFGNYSATYGSIGAVIVLMLWLYITGLVMLVGSEINALIEHFRPEGKSKGEKKEPQAA
jgi:membrane protein